MENKLKIWREGRSWQEAEAEWESRSTACQKSHPLKTLKTLPQIPGITQDTARGLKFKAVKYLLSHDKERIFLRYFFKHPLKYTLRWLKSALKKKSFTRSGDFFFYGISDCAQFSQALKEKETILVVGFSYCHKPLECPSGRFTDACIHDLENPVCRQCFIGKTVHALPREKKEIVPLFIPTIHYIGGKLFDLVDRHPDKKILFLITACELTLEMFSDWGNMIDVKGIGVRLDGRICNTMRAFELSEEGIKPGLTVVLPETQEKILALIQELWKD